MDLDLIVYLGFWYVGNMAYSTYNRNASEEFKTSATFQPGAVGNSKGEHFAMAIATAQLAVGVVYGVYLWFAPECRKLPKLSIADFIRLIPAGVMSAGAHAASVFSLAAGGVAFGQIVKSTEPVFSAIIGTVFYKKKESLAKWLCLIPIIGGVAITVLKPEGFCLHATKTRPLFNPSFEYQIQNILKFELDGGFSMGSLVGAMIANSCAAFKASETSKIFASTETDASGTTLKTRLGGAVNQFAVMTIVSLLSSIPLVFIYPVTQGQDMMVNVNAFYNQTFSNPKALQAIIYSGLAFYLYNEFATLSLTKLSVVTASVANTAKRVFVIVAGIIMFEEEKKKATLYTVIGCTICMLGVGLYACIDDLLKKKEPTKAKTS